MKTINVPLRALREHPAQMRTEMGAEEMARLALQVYQRGLDAYQPIVAAANGDGSYRVVSGHRRWLAALLAAEIRTRADGRKGDVDLDLARQVIVECASASPATVIACAACGAPVEPDENDDAWCPACGDWVGAAERSALSPTTLMGLYGPLTERHGDVTAPVALFEGSEKEEILALQAANFGQETPDLLGQARSYAAAVQAGATAAEIAANTGQAASHVEAVLALHAVPAALAQAVLAGDVALGVAAVVSRLRKKAQQEGVVRYILERGRCTVGEAQEVVSALGKWKPPAVSLDPQTRPEERNQARLLAALWAEVSKQDPARAWYAAAWWIAAQHVRLSYLGVTESAPELLARLAPEARCENCRLRDLLRQAPPFPYPSYPCQREAEPVVCLAGVFGQDPFYAQVPFTWEGYPGVQRDGGSRAPVCLSAGDFAQALDAATAEREGRSAPEQDDVPAAPAGYAAPPASALNVDDIGDQRALIRSYIEGHAALSGARHPLATRCEECRYRLDGSPTQDPGVPPCQWAARRRWVEFKVRVPVENDGGGPEIPLCRQFAPSGAWNAAIPAHPAPPGMPREWMAGVMREMVETVERRKAAASNCRLVGERLTGRPLKAAEFHGGWFLEGLQNEIGNLSDGQLWTLVTWVVADWMRDQGNSYLLPLPDGRALRYTERTWQPVSGNAPQGDASQGDEGA